MKSLNCAILFALSATFAHGGSLEGQPTSTAECQPPRLCTPPAARDVAAHLRAEARDKGRMPHALLALIQGVRDQAPEELDALADSIVEVGVGLAAQGTPEGRSIGRLAAETLLGSAFYTPSGQPARGVPYPRGVDRAIEIAYRLPGGDLELVNMARPLIGDEEWLGHMRQFAISDLDPSAALAVVTLEWEGPTGLAVLRRVFEEGLAVNPRAVDYLEELAEQHGWMRVARA